MLILLNLFLCLDKYSIDIFFLCLSNFTLENTIPGYSGRLYFVYMFYVIYIGSINGQLCERLWQVRNFLLLIYPGTCYVVVWVLLYLLVFNVGMVSILLGYNWITFPLLFIIEKLIKFDFLNWLLIHVRNYFKSYSLISSLLFVFNRLFVN